MAVGGEGLGAVGAVDGKVEVGVGGGECGGHGEGVVEVGEGGTGGKVGGRSPEPFHLTRSCV